MPYVMACLSDRALEPIYLFGGDEDGVLYCSAECRAWLHLAGHDAQLPRLQWMKHGVPLSSFIFVPALSPARVTLPALIDQFPLAARDMTHLISVFHFFSAFHARPDDSLTIRLEQALVAASYPSPPAELLARLVQFISVLPESAAERLRLPLSRRIRPFLLPGASLNAPRKEDLHGIHSLLPSADGQHA